MNDEEHELFRKEMADVIPLKSQSMERLTQPPRRLTPGQIYRREAAQRSVHEENALPTSFIEPVDPEAVIRFQRPGVQNGVFRNLEHGRYHVEATLDLHLMTIEEARTQVYLFIRDCLRYEVRTALINHGKGGRRGRQAIIKSCIARWLPLFPEVMAFHSAQRFHGGTGAVYVLLRKSEHAKELTRESLGLKSGKPAP